MQSGGTAASGADFKAGVASRPRRSFFERRWLAQSVDEARGQLGGEAVEQGATRLRTEVAGVHVAVSAWDGVGVGQGQRPSGDERPRDRVGGRVVASDQLGQRNRPQVAQVDPLAKLDVAERIDVDAARSR